MEEIKILVYQIVELEIQILNNLYSIRTIMNGKYYSLHEAYLGVYESTNSSEVFQKEDVELYDLVLEYLIDEGFVDSEDAARNIMSVMSEEWKNSILLDWQMKQVTPKQRERYAVALRNLADTQEKIRNEKPQASQEEKRKRTTNLANVRLR